MISRTPEEFESHFDDPPLPDFDASEVASAHETVLSLVDGAKRKSQRTPIRNGFVQILDLKGKAVPGPLAALVKRRDRRALILFLLIVTAASKAPWDVRRPALLWARALGLDPNKPSARTAVSKAFRRLDEDLKLIRRSYSGRVLTVTLLSEEGTGDPYIHPGDPSLGAAQGHYFRFPNAFWTDRWYEKLDLAEIAMLLVLLTLPPDRPLPVKQVPKWYGISSATAQRGLVGLRKKGLLASRWIQVKDPGRSEGYRYDLLHRLTGPFDLTVPAPPPRPAAVDIPDPTTAADPENDTTQSAPRTPSARRRHRRRNTAANRKEEVPMTTATTNTEGPSP